MRGKIVNLCVAFMNLLFGALIIVYTSKVPQDKTIMTVQENYVVNYILIAIYVIMGIIALFNLIQSYYNRSDTTFNTGYVIGIFCISFFFIKSPFIATFNIICGLIVLIKSIKENLVELNSTFAISVSIVVMTSIVILAILSTNYATLGNIIKNKENENELKYKDDYFKYITELEIEDVYINIKKDGKFGYINQKGETVIDFKYDYASPFIEINMYEKKFYIALVCIDGSSKVILKNEREVLSYRTESSDENYKGKLEELEKIYKETLEQKSPMKFEIENTTNNINRAPAYNIVSDDYTFKFDYSKEYDLIVTQSNMGLNDTYELVKKDESGARIPLYASNLDYDASYLYLFSNGSIPFYEISKRIQGWYTSYGMKNEMSGKAQILDFFGERILLKDYNKNTIYFCDTSANKLSEEYQDIYVCNDGRYIVRDNEGFCKIIDDEYNRVFENQYEVINPRLLNSGLYLVLPSTENIKFNDYKIAKINWSLLNYNGEVILDGIEYIYDQVYVLPEKSKEYDVNYYQFQNELRDLKYEFVGDKFYSNYKKNIKK